MSRTVAVVAEGIIWEQGILDAPGPLIEGAAEKLQSLLPARIIILTPCANTLHGSRRCLDLLYREGIPFDELWVSGGFPNCDEVVLNGKSAH